MYIDMVLGMTWLFHVIHIYVNVFSFTHFFNSFLLVGFLIVTFRLCEYREYVVKDNQLEEYYIFLRGCGNCIFNFISEKHSIQTI